MQFVSFNFEIMYKILIFVVLFLNIFNIIQSFTLYSNNLHRNHLKPRIIGGNDVKSNHRFPWMVSIVYYGKHHCGGSIINQKTILTAAHCTIFLNLRFIKIRAGSIYHSSGGQLIPVENVKAHEKFYIGTMDYDIGIMRLKYELKFDLSIRPIFLQKTDNIIKDGVKAVVTGWGALSDLMVYPEILQYLQIEIMNNTECNKYMKNSITDRMLCAGYLDGGKDTCNLDSGGPLVYNFKLIGLVSWGYKCASVNRLGVYANISNLRPWVEETLFADYSEQLPDSLDGFL